MREPIYLGDGVYLTDDDYQLKLRNMKYNKDGKLHVAAFEIVEDMTQIEAGGFKRGAKINLLEMQKLLADRMLAKGTTVRYMPTGELYHVDYGGVYD